MAIATREGVVVRCDAHSERVLVRGGRTAGVAPRGGEEIPARDVVSTISARPLAALRPDEALPHRLLRRLRIWRNATAAFKLDYALRAPVPWTAREARRAAVVHVGGGLQELAAAAPAGASVHRGRGRARNGPCRWDARGRGAQTPGRAGVGVADRVGAVAAVQVDALAGRRLV